MRTKLISVILIAAFFIKKLNEKDRTMTSFRNGSTQNPKIFLKNSTFLVKQITSPGWMHETSTGTWCSGKTWRERVEREVGGGIGMGKTCKPKAISFQCMTKFTTNKKN